MTSISILWTLLLLPSRASASTCRNLTNVRWGSDTPNSFATTNIVPLEHVNCPPNVTVPYSAVPSCTVPRNVYNITVPRLINIAVSPEDEDAIFERARITYWESGSQRDNMSIWDEEWVAVPRIVDTRENGREGGSDFFFETSAAYDYTLYVSFSLHGFLDGKEECSARVL